MIFQPFIELENAFESGLQQKAEVNSYLNWLLLLEQKRFSEFYNAGEELLVNEGRFEMKGFLSVWLIIGSETQYDMERRNKYLKIFDKIRQKEFNVFLEYYRLYFSSITYFYEAQLTESESLINRAYQIAVNLKYHRGQSRCLYQKSILQFDLKQNVEARKSLKQCMDLCSEHTFLKTKDRALTEYCNQNGVKPESDIESLMFSLREALRLRELSEARLLLAHAETLRRKSGFSKRKYSLYFYRIQLLFLQNRFQAARLGLAKIDDQVIKSQMFDFMIFNNIELTTNENNQNKILKFHLGQNFEAIHVKSIRSSEIQKLVTLLVQSEFPLAKEKIFHLVYEYEYDPTLHDSKLYKLILRARKELADDLIINHYGKYSLNLEKYRVVI